VPLGFNKPTIHSVACLVQMMMMRGKYRSFWELPCSAADRSKGSTSRTRMMA